jgi:hypothetical protein
MRNTSDKQRATGAPLNDLAESGMNCQTPQRSAPDAPQTPLCCVRRWTGKGWRAVSKPLPRRDALNMAAEMKVRGASGFHVRVEPEAGNPRAHG